MDPRKMTQQNGTAVQETACPILSAAALIQGGPKASLLSCVREKCGFWNVIAMVTPDGEKSFVAGCGVSQAASFLAATHQAIANAAGLSGVTAVQELTPKEEEGVAVHIPKKPNPGH